ncbi:MAG: type I DNA topoisomerase [Nitrospiraceae bacterium]|nr:type I DNA topoisomerase [Nitrospiraceae bacterium]
MKSLVIVESPAKAKTISKILGKDFTVKASVGHIKDLPAKEMGIDIEHDFTPQYIVIPGKEKVIKELRKAAKEADTVYIAPDPDREGEAIAWHIAEEVKDKKKTLYRIKFNEITKSAVLEAVKNPGEIDMMKVDAQQARRILDRLVGYELSPLLWRKVRRGLSAGRVQSVAVRLVVDREREIEAFKQEEYWSINAEFEGSSKPSFWSRLFKYQDEKVEIGNAETAESVVSSLRDSRFILASIDRKKRKRMPSPPFITSTLQQEASRKLRFTAKKTMAVAQQLYEGIELGEEGAVGLITYMRTDSNRISAEAQKAAREYIEQTYGKEFLPEKPPVYKSKASAQEAHEAVRPTYMTNVPEQIKHYLSKEQFSLYKLIWNRFVASQMAPAELELTTFDISPEQQKGRTIFRATGSVVKFQGFMALYTEGTDELLDENESLLPSLTEGEGLRLLDLQPKQHFTQPPPRYTEASLVKALEEKGIGRPSTYAAIMSTIQDRKYVQKTDGKFSPTELGVVVNDLLVERFSELMDIGFTANLEEDLDHIEDGKTKWVKVVSDFYAPFHGKLAEALAVPGKVKPQDIPTEATCEKCGKPMVIRWGRHGRFMACSGFPECKNAKPLDGDKPAQEPVETDEKCPKCGSPMLLKSGRFGKFYACSGYPECKTTKPISTGVKCPEDGGDIVERRSKRGRSFWSCSNYPKCKFATWNKPVAQKCPQCGAPFLGEKWSKGGDVSYVCLNKECSYKVEVKKEEPTAAGV